VVVRHQAIETADTVARVILEAAAHEHADLIALGTHAKTGVSRMVLGSVSEEILEHSPIAVLLVHATRSAVAGTPANIAAATGVGLAGFVNGGHFFDLLAEDVIFEYVISVPGYPRRVDGRLAVAELYRGYGSNIVLQSADELAVHRDTEASVVVLEYAVHGQAIHTGRPALSTDLLAPSAPAALATWTSTN
jgi:hypothetical protein